MVNLKKIGVIAASALFLGATVGMASAASFSSTMLVSNGVAKAKVVTGTANPDATGLTADEASAKVITDAVASTFTTSTGGGIVFNYDSGDIDDVSSTADDFTRVAAASVATWELKWIFTDAAGITNTTQLGSPNANLVNNTKDLGLRYDATGDGDVSDSDDYSVYNDIYVEERTINQLTITPVMRVGSAATLLNNIFELKGTKYLVTSKSDTKDEIELAPVSEKTLLSTGGNVLISIPRLF